MADKYIHIRLGNPVAWLTTDDRPAAAAMQEGVVGWEMTTNQWFVVYGHQWRTYRTPDSLAADRMADLVAKLTADHDQTLAALATTNTLLEDVRDTLQARISIAETEIPGIGTGSPYAAGDAFGTKFELKVPEKGIIQTVVFYDLDDEGLAKTLYLFSQDFTGTADNSALDISDTDLLLLVGHIQIAAADFADAGSGRVATVRVGPGLRYVAPEGRLWCQVQTQGADNIAAGSIPRLELRIEEAR